MNEPITGGALESKADYRDGIAALAAAPTVEILPLSYQTDFSRFGVFMQAKQSACVSHAWAKIMQLWWYKAHGEIIEFSPRFLDILSSEPDIPLDGGRRPRTVAKISATFGCATTKTLPNDTSLPIAAYRSRTMVTDAALAEAKKYRIPGYLRVPVDQLALREHTALYGAVSILMLIGQEWWTPSWADKDIDPLRPPRATVSGHEVIAKGWVDHDYNTLLNSWSRDWANHGEANYSYRAWEPYIREGWTIAEIPHDVIAYLRDLPAPDNFHYRWEHNLSYGDFNADVKFLQVALMITGFMPPVPPDQLGYYGVRTSRAVGAYQHAQGIYPAPDSCGPLTRKALNQQFAI